MPGLLGKGRVRAAEEAHDQVFVLSEPVAVESRVQMRLPEINFKKQNEVADQLLFIGSETKAR